MMPLKVSLALLCICSILFACSIILYFQSQPSGLQLRNQSYLPHLIQPGKYQSAPLEKMKTNIFFLKTHKTASTTIVSIVIRFGVRHSLNFMLLDESGNGRNCRKGFNCPITFEDLNSEIVPLDNKFNILAIHTRYRKETNEFMYPDVMRVTILRSPPEQFESFFSFMGIAEKVKLSWPKFVQSIATDSNISLEISRLRNIMSRDLGLDKSKFENEKQISEFIRFVDEEFHLVMITEHMEASLVLLADLMSWPLHYVASIGKRVRSSTARNNISDEDRRTLLRHNHADHRLYEHFLAAFRRRVLEYGFERMTANMQRLRAFDQELQERCVAASDYKGQADTMVYETKATSGKECQLEVETGSLAWKIARNEQMLRLASIKRLRNLVAPTGAPAP